MKLIDIIAKLNDIDEELIIFQEDRDNLNSDTFLFYGEDGDRGIKIENEKKYYYLIEVFLAKEFVEDLIGSLDYLPDKKEIAERLYEYAKNDA